MNIDDFLEDMPERFKIPYFSGFNDGSFSFSVFESYVEGLSDFSEKFILSRAKSNQSPEMLRGNFEKFLMSEYLVFENSYGDADCLKWMAADVVEKCSNCINWRTLLNTLQTKRRS